MDIHPTISPNFCTKHTKIPPAPQLLFSYVLKKVKEGDGGGGQTQNHVQTVCILERPPKYLQWKFCFCFIYRLEFIASQHVTTRHGLIKINFTSTTLKLWSLKLCTNKEFWQTLIINRWCTLFTGLHNFHSTNCTNVPLFEGFPLHECHTGHPLMELLILWTKKRCQRIKL